MSDNNMPGEVERIAEKLTAAQRRSLMAYTPATGPGMWPVRNAMRRLGLFDGIRGEAVTPLGLAVRAALTQQESRNAE